MTAIFWPHDEELTTLSKLVRIYRAPDGYAPTAGSAQAWGGWFAAIGSHIVDPGDQVFARDGVGPTVAGSRLAGLSVIDAEDLPSAVSLATGCPGVEDGFTVEVGQLASAG